MALLDDPRFFLMPVFHFEPDGTFARGNAVRPEPSSLFQCAAVELTGHAPRLPVRSHSRLFPITINPEAAPRLFLSSMHDDMPLFWQGEIFTERGKQCDEEAYQGFWRLRLSNATAYCSFREESGFGKLAVAAQGRLLDIAIYFLLLEAEPGIWPKVLQRLEAQDLKPVISARWSELTPQVALNLSPTRSLCRELAKDHAALGQIIDYLAPEPANLLRRLFGR
ncbi:MAG: hypothetical protein C5B50_14075 [Verrucomicrobia bacterium]|nr:MAG: hypothetical protein C5B50_14075 [Verrucomicrobiota bacterium]